MKFRIEIDLPDDDFLKEDNRKVVAEALEIKANALRYDCIYKRPLLAASDGKIDLLRHCELVTVGKWEVAQ